MSELKSRPMRVPEPIGMTPVDVNDAVRHPIHYTQGRIECIDFIQDKRLNFAKGNAIKYIVRAGHKCPAGENMIDNAIEDLRKAIQYLEFEINDLIRERYNDDGNLHSYEKR